MITADNGVAHLSADEERVDMLELHGNATIAGSTAGAGGLQALRRPRRDADSTPPTARRCSAR